MKIQSNQIGNAALPPYSPPTLPSPLSPLSPLPQVRKHQTLSDANLPAGEMKTK